MDSDQKWKRGDAFNWSPPSMLKYQVHPNCKLYMNFDTTYMNNVNSYSTYFCFNMSCYSSEN